MKTLLAIAIISFSALVTQAQTVTNLTIKCQVDVIVTGVSTNSTTDNLNLLASGSKKDQNRINGWAYAFSQYRAAGGQLAFGAWLKQDVADRADAYAAVKAQADNAALAAKISNLLLQNPDLLSNSDLSSLSTIAAKAP